MDGRDGPASFCGNWKQSERHEGIEDTRRTLNVLDDFSTAAFTAATLFSCASPSGASASHYSALIVACVCAGVDTGARRGTPRAPALANVVDIVVEVKERVT